MELTGDKTPFWEKYHIEKKPEFEDIDIQEMDFSVRLYKRLKNDLSVKSLLDLVNLCEDDLLKVSGLGRGSIEELILYIKDFKDKMGENRAEETNYIAPLVFRNNKERIFRKDLSFCDTTKLDEDEKVYIRNIREGFEFFDQDILEACYYNTDYMVVIANVFQNFAKALYIKEKRKKCLRKILDSLQENKKELLVSGLIKAYTSDDYLRDLLINPTLNKSLSLKEYIESDYVITDVVYTKVCSFLKWCDFDLDSEITEIADKLFKNERAKEIVELRASGLTLGKIGDRFSVTRERIRQIEKKVITRFNTAINGKNIIMKIYAVRNEDDILTPIELREYFGDNTNVFIYLLKHCSSVSYIYDHDLDVIVVGDGTYTSKVADYIDSLPEEFDIKKYEEYINIAVHQYELPDELVEKAIKEEYKLTGSMYHRTRLTLANIYISIIKQYFPNGIRAYEDNDVNQLRQYIYEMYGDVKLPNTNRAVGARISSVCVLCDRGMYIPKKDEYISKELLNKIEEYIDNSDNPVFLMNTLFYMFKDELESYGILNKYYLQGILKELTGEKYRFKKDYLLKGEAEFGLYDDIVSFIEQFDYPVTKEELRKHFVGVTEIMFSFAVADKKILNYFGAYLHASKLKMSHEERLELEKIVNDVMLNQNAYHSKDLFQIIQNQMQLFLKRNGIRFGFQLFSVLEYLLDNKYDFRRPYIVKKGENVTRPLEKVEEYIYSEEIVLLSNLMSYARSAHAAVPSIIELVKCYSEDYLLVDNETLACYNYIGMTRNKINYINQLIADEISDTVPIRDLKCINNFPEINVEWNEWLIYGIASQSAILDVALTSTQLRQAVPLVAPRGKMNIHKYESVSFDQNSQLYQLDDLNKIDDLLLEIDDDEW